MEEAATPFDVGVEGAVLGDRYRRGRVLGHGAMGIVCAAHDILLDRPVALKIVDPAQSSPHAVRFFQREAQALARIRHRNVVQIYTVGVHEALHFFVMEYVEGRDVDALISEEAARGQRIALERTLDIIRQVASGLDSVHAHGLLHRDVKPSNIVVESKTGRAVLIDFGLARPKERQSRRWSSISGTPWYMAPEQASDAPTATSSRSDLYSLACTAFHMLTGRAVFDHTDPYRVIIAHAESTPSMLSSIVPELAPLDAVFQIALSKAPDGRYPTCAAFVDALEGAASGIAKPRARTSRPPPPSSPGSPLRVLLYGPRDGVRSRVEDIVTRTLSAAGDAVALEGVETPTQFLSALAQAPADIVVLEETAPRVTEHLVSRARHAKRGEHTEILVFVRDLAHDVSRLDELGARVLPMPVDSRVAATAVSRMGLRLAQTRRASSSEPPPQSVTPADRQKGRRDGGTAAFRVE